MPAYLRPLAFASLAGVLSFSCSSAPAPEGVDAGPERCAANADCDDGLFCNGAETCDVTDPAASADGCVDGARPCSAGCDEEQDQCSGGTCRDGDNDGVEDVACGGSDCDDEDSNRFPGNPEVCDALDHDEDCNPATYGAVDGDSDGVDDAACCNVNAVGVRLCGRDCDDESSSISPLAPEVCNGVDDNCDGLADEGVLVVLWPDADEDGFGTNDPGATSVNGCPGTRFFAQNQTDCNDAAPAINPSASELCDGVNQDCDANIDENITFRDYYPDCDSDGGGELNSTGTNGCVPPAAPPAQCAQGTWSLEASDCNDADTTVGRLATETCNGVDDDCDGLTDDVSNGVVVCELDETVSCMTGCGVTGVRTCSGCTMFGACVADEICNGCDDDGNGATDEGGGRVCVMSMSEACTTACGATGGQRVCNGSCQWGTCLRSDEACNFCDDNGVNGIQDEKVLATGTSSARAGCDATFKYMSATGAPCVAPLTGSDRFVTAPLMDGTQNNQAGAVWFDTDELQGWGTTTIRAEVRVRVHPENGVTSVENPLGGWSLVVTSAPAGSWSVGTPADRGRPDGLSGLSVDWFWTGNTGYCAPPPNNFPPGGNGDLLGVYDDDRRLGAASATPGCADGGGVGAGNLLTPRLDAATTAFVTQVVTLRYTPDDPGTTSINEERIELDAGGYSFAVNGNEVGSGAEPPRSQLSIGSPLRIGITAGSYVGSGYDFIPAANTYGVPVEAEARLYVIHNPGTPIQSEDDVFEFEVTGVCP